MGGIEARRTGEGVGGELLEGAEEHDPRGHPEGRRCQIHRRWPCAGWGGEITGR